MGTQMRVKVDGEVLDNPVMSVRRLHVHGIDEWVYLIRVLPAVDIELSQSEALALASDLIRAVNR